MQDLDSNAAGLDGVGSSVSGHVGIVELQRPPHNYFDLGLLSALADAFEAMESDPQVRAIVLCAQGDAFCAGADFSNPDSVPKARYARATNPLYAEAIRLFSTAKPIVAAIHGAAVGGGLGLALVADFRIGCAEARFSANFTRLGISPGFGLTVSLPRLIGRQKASWLFLTGRRIGGEEALALGLVDRLVARDQVRQEAMALAEEIAGAAPAAVEATRAALRDGFEGALRQAVARESIDQNRLFDTQDFVEGVAAMRARRPPVFQRR